MNKIDFHIEHRGRYTDNYNCIEYLETGAQQHSMTMYKKTKYVSCGCNAKVQPCTHKICFLETFKHVYNL